MEITRRRFAGLIVTVSILCAAGISWLVTLLAPRGFTAARKPTAFPGRLRPLDEEKMRQAGKWSG